MIKSTELLTIEIINGKMTNIQVHPVCKHCGKDLINNKIDLPPLENGIIDTTTTGFECPNDKKIEIITVSDIEKELDKINKML